ncbi:hypothetical protein [Methylobacterium symbioticum]|uniref:Uncharacterized protein n=1 Tax=Methylobacterium symbioticum TaxID=2584084 RepID=A0A509EG29_9HYPH|nr:hypothetical protein [Methylobacterium symbioticum]VUD73130.1 hypothetical protein MET9862_03744 [Methylobacterium symbioticum]
MNGFSGQIGSQIHFELDGFGLYVVAGEHEFFWQFGLGFRNFALCTVRDREMVAVG